MDWAKFLDVCTVNEFKRQGETIGQPVTYFRAWIYEGLILIVNEERNTPVVAFDSRGRIQKIYDEREAGRLMLAGAGVL